MALSRSRILGKALLTRPIFGSRWERLYYIKTEKYGRFSEVYDYHKIQATFTAKREDYTKHSEGTKSEKSVYRVRNKIYKIVEANRGRHGKFKAVFFTLTYRQGTKELKTANKDVKALMRRLKGYLGYSVKYIIVPERHESGNIHYHGVFFNLPFIHVVKFKEEIWKLGSVDLQLPKKIRSVAAYLSKYLTEDTHKSLKLNDKAYFTSRGLFRPETLYTNEYPSDTIKALKVSIHKKYIKTLFICKNLSSYQHMLE